MKFVKIQCPICGREGKDPSLVYFESGYMKCHNCNATNDTEFTTTDGERITLYEWLKRLADSEEQQSE